MKFRTLLLAVMMMLSAVMMFAEEIYLSDPDLTSADIQSIRDYYDPVSGLTGTALLTGLRNLIDTNTNSSYDGSKTYMFQTCDSQNHVVRCVYTGEDFTITSSYNGSTNPNTEHTYAQSWFSVSANVEKADVHHLFPTDSTVNSSRGNLPFDEVVNQNTTYSSYNGYVSKRGTNAGGQTVFEPADQHKGDLARALLYFNVRYGEPLTRDGVNMLPTLKLWHQMDPPSTAEITRNTKIYTFQTNRNPFVDHPEYVARIWGGTENEDATMPIAQNGIVSVYPNPMTSTTTLQYHNAKSGVQMVNIYNVHGQKVRSLNLGTMEAGLHEANWNGSDDRNITVPAGIYFCRMMTGADQSVKKIVVIR